MLFVYVELDRYVLWTFELLFVPEYPERELPEVTFELLLLLVAGLVYICLL